MAVNLAQLAGPFSIYILFNFTTLLLEVPLVRLFELAICHRHFRDLTPPLGGFDESACKVPAIQDALGHLVGWKMFFDAVPGILMAIYYGYLAEKIGCRAVLGMATAGYVLMLAWIVLICSSSPLLPAQMSWFSSIFLFIGGGQRVFNSMVFTLTSKALPETQRTKYLYLLAVGPHICRLVSPRLAAALMGYRVLAPFWLAFACLGLIGCIIPFSDRSKGALPEAEYQPITNDGDGEPLLPPPPATQDQPESVSSDEPASLSKASSVSDTRMSKLRKKIVVISKLFDSPASRFCLAAFFIKRLAFASEGFMFQYASERFKWELRQTTWLRVSSAAGAVFATLAVGVLLNNTSRKRESQSRISDLNTIRLSLVVLVISFLGAWLAPSAPLLLIAMIGCGLGEALEPALQGFAITSTGSARNSLLFTTVAQCDTLAELIAGPLMATFLAIGRTASHPSNGFCFLASSVMFSGLFAWSCII